ncbi:hypothetical protein OEA41_008540 [Lepraria neglecta]|uniref:EKC/KEOPS complex subunit BUD32 n=1 Tax=Lepraria neglecta TaxID=209136 RepID=A0AAD9ZEM4_9LECA|nr:hypothetical protein OEA41_008540 [Lepraria neglecta]
MDNLSLDDRAIIAKHPLANSLDHLHDSLRKVEQNYEPGSPSHHDAVDSPDSGPQKEISRLLYTLQGHEVADNLRSKIGSGDIASELSMLFRRVRKSGFNYKHYRALSQLVIKQAPDVDIWNAVLNLIITVSQITPPTSLPPSYDGTPIKHSSASQQGSEQTRELVEARVFEEIRTCMYRNVGGFFSKYFEGKDWTEQTKEIYRTVKQQQASGRWTEFPDQPEEKAVLSWLFRFQDEFLSNAQGIYYTAKSSKNLTGGEARRQLNFFIKRRSNISGPVHNWKDAQVICELKESYDSGEFKSRILQIGRYMRDVFTAQPTRRFIHGFSLYGTIMELWVFDRSGPYSSGEFDIYKEPEQFIRAIAGYTMMSDEELGLDTFVERDGEDRFIIITEDMTRKERRLQLEPALIAYQRAIVCRGTSCFRASIPSSKDPRYVVKFSWTSDMRQPEVDLLRLARERGVEGVAKLFGDYRITSIADMREGLTFGNIAGNKRKPVGSRGSPSKRSRSYGQSHNTAKQENEVAYTMEYSQTTSLYTYNKSSFDNRIFRCLVISPAGRAIRDFGSILELLKALRDAIKAHRSLYTAGKILHRDISENNIIITDPKEADGFTGILIDQDLAKEIGSGPSGARHQTGTMEFMAIEVLRLVSHSYRHDLESFFYVLLWICARRAWEREFKCKLKDRPERNILTKWYTGGYDDIADAKAGYMHVDGFDKILEEFPQAFDRVKPLCKKIRGILFPLHKDGELFIGTPSDPPEKLYDPIIEAFENAIAIIEAFDNAIAGIA